ncbi:DegT/DnrJ/EryC1/StrS family aminotransferase [Ruegeria atlantica]|uniref:DegT/DnrJ/EryC1/StrS family aminotransferase n=1 Tax=Ruegeria atlantica TaxID=81569 RepID=UPI00147C8468|nr:DegT/DnrJ/EryC1/StrS family aminotransferase [Ruegeria atlantica]
MTRNRIADAVANMPMRADSFWKQDAQGGILALFAKRKVHYAFQTRVAIHAACDVLKLQDGDEILAPAYNCGSEIDPLVQAGLKVRLYPVGKDLRADPARIEPLITARTRAIYVTHYIGILQPELTALRALCNSYGLRMIEDCALSLLSGKSPAEGRTGDISVFCFHKFVPVPEGGALVVNAPDLTAAAPFPRPAPGKVVAKIVARSTLVNVLGSTRARILKRALSGGSGMTEPDHVTTDEMDDIPGHYYFDPDLQRRRISVVASRQLRSFSVSDTIKIRRANWHRYRERLEKVQGVEMLKSELETETCPLIMPLVVNGRDRAARDLQARGIGATPWWAGFHRNLDWTGQDEAIALKNQVLSLPLHQYLSEDHIDHIVSALKDVLSS